MNKGIKIFLGVMLALFVLVAAAGLYLSRNLPHLVKQAVETYAPKTTGTPVKLGGVRVNFMTGTVTLKNFVVGNPKGYTSDHAFQFDGLQFSLDLSTIFHKLIVIREFSIEGANIIAEQHGSITHTNLQEIADHAQSITGAAETPVGTNVKDNNVKDNNAKGKAVRKLIVSKLAFTNNTVDMVSEALGSRKIKLPDIVLKDIGKSEGGLTPEQMTQRITQLVTAQVSDAVREELKKIAVEKGKDTVLDKVKSWFGK